MGRTQRKPKNQTVKPRKATADACLGDRSCTSPFAFVADCEWFWLHISTFLTLPRCFYLRQVSGTAADVLLSALEEMERSQASFLASWDLAVFHGLLSDLKKITPSMECFEVESGDSCRRSLFATSLGSWVTMTKQITRAYPRDSSGFRLQDKDVSEMPSGTILLLHGRVMISNCFNSLVQRGPHVDGGWLYRVHGGCACLEKFGKTKVQIQLTEYQCFVGRILLPKVTAQWRYIVDIFGSESDGDVAAVLTLENEGEMIQHIAVPPNLASAARAAITSQNQEALLLRWALQDEDYVCVRVAIYDVVKGLQQVVDEVPITSHERWAIPPESAASLHP